MTSGTGGSAQEAVGTRVGRPIVTRVTQEHHVAHARQEAVNLARQVGMDQVGSHVIATCVTELASNLFFHAGGGGTITIATLRRDHGIGIEIICEDHGPGIPDVGLAMRDGFSTARGLGAGLAGAKRLMDEFEIASKPGVGTRIVTRKWQQCK